MYAFTYHRATSLAEAESMLGSMEEAKILAGGHTLLPTMKQRLAAPANLIDLGGIEELSGIERHPDRIVIGAMTRYHDIATAPELRDAIPALAEMTATIGDPAVRHRGTIGGSVANNDPSADYAAAALALGATIVTNRREIHADAFFKGLFETALDDGEIVTRLSFPIPGKAGYAKFRNPASRYALAGVFAAQRSDGVRVAVTGSGANGVFRWTAAEEALGRDFSQAALEGLAMSPEGLASDIHADAIYRAHLIGVMTRRAVAAAR